MKTHREKPPFGLPPLLLLSWIVSSCAFSLTFNESAHRLGAVELATVFFAVGTIFGSTTHKDYVFKKIHDLDRSLILCAALFFITVCSSIACQRTLSQPFLSWGLLFEPIFCLIFCSAFAFLPRIFKPSSILIIAGTFLFAFSQAESKCLQFVHLALCSLGALW